jgi:hypothetical protein
VALKSWVDPGLGFEHLESEREKTWEFLRNKTLVPLPAKYSLQGQGKIEIPDAAVLPIRAWPLYNLCNHLQHSLYDTPLTPLTLPHNLLERKRKSVVWDMKCESGSC